jgi:4-alpha-glucanotransferase
MGDIPILIDRESADCWLHQDCFDFRYSAGSPPDIYSENGQNWGFPIYNWEVIEKNNFSWWVDRLKSANRYYHLYRLDHIVGFFRIWSIPWKQKGKEGHFIPLDESIWIDHGQKILLMMLNACDMLPIGEDLGIVPPEVKSCLNAMGICGTRVMRWERRWNEDQQFIKPEHYPVESMSTVSTHDSETLPHWWKSCPTEAQLYANSKGWTYHPQLSREHHREILWESHHTKSIFHINLLQEYLPLTPGLSWSSPEEDRINIPGLVSSSNWTYRYKPTLEELADEKSLQHIMKELIA